jgi:hypothetical protein
MSTKLLLLTVCTALTSRGADVVWTNTAGGNWSVAANWSPNQLPGAGDTAIITNNGTYSVTLNTGPTLAGLVLGGAGGTQTLAQAAHQLTLNGLGFVGAQGRYQLTSGTLAGQSLLTVAGQMTWNGGTIQNDAAVEVETSGLLLLGGTSKNLNGALTNAGRVVWSDASDLNQNGWIHNQVGGVFEVRNDRTLNYVSGSRTFFNDGILLKSAGTGVSDFETTFVNRGTVAAQTGTIQFSAQPKTLGHGSRFLGAGIVLLQSGTVTLEGAIDAENLRLGGATLDGSGVLSGAMSWQSGPLAANLTVASNGTLHVAATTAKTLSGSLANAGRVVVSDAHDLTLSGHIHNRPGGVWEIRNDRTLNWPGGSPVFLNDGTVLKSAGPGLSDLEIEFVNHGTVEVRTGTLQFSLRPKTLNDGSRFVGAGVCLLQSGTVTWNGVTESENLRLQGATLAGAGALAGTMTWAIGTLLSNASLTVTPQGVLLFSTVGVKSIDGALTNAGAVVWTDSADLGLAGWIHNRAGGVWEIRNDRTLNWPGGDPVFLNDGTVLKSAGTGLTDIETRFINNGTVEARTGTVQFSYQPKTFNAGCRFTGTGISLLSGCTVALAGEIYSENLVLGGATVTGAGGVTGSFTWNSGTLTPDVSFNVTPSGLLLLASSGGKTLNGAITNGGVVRWTGTGNLTVRGAIHNLPGGLFDAQNDEVLDFASGRPVIVNEGTFRKAVGAATTLCQIPFRNLGRVEADSGTLNFTGAFTDLGGEIALGGGRVQTIAPLTLSSGRLTGRGTVLNSVLSTGLVRPAVSNGVLRIQGSYTQLLPGTLELELAGTAAGANHSRLEVTGNAAVAGTIGVRLADGYLPAPGDAFNVLAFASHTGDFTCHNGFLFLGQNRRLLKQYAGTSLTLATVSAPDPTDVVLSVGAQQTSAIVCWPTEFVGYSLYAATNLTTPEWTPQPSVTNRYLETPMASEKFFRLSKP